MEWYFIVLIVVAVLILIMFIPLFLQLRFYLNIKDNMGVIMITLFGFIKLTCFQIQVKRTAINIIKKHKDDKEVPLKVLDEQMVFMQCLISRLFWWLKINELSVFFGVGAENDAAKPALANGVLLALAYSMISVLRTKKGDLKSYVGAESKSDEDMLKFSGYFSIVIVPLAILIAIIRSKIESKRVVKRYEELRARFYGDNAY